MSARRISHDPERVDRKTLQLCKQVERTLNLVLSGECDDEVLQDLIVTSVRPMGGSSQLLVVVEPSVSETAPSVVTVLDHLQRAKSRLREMVAEAITRRKAPELTFQVRSPLLPDPALG